MHLREREWKEEEEEEEVLFLGMDGKMKCKRRDG